MFRAAGGVDSSSRKALIFMLCPVVGPRSGCPDPAHGGMMPSPPGGLHMENGRTEWDRANENIVLVLYGLGASFSMIRLVAVPGVTGPLGRAIAMLVGGIPPGGNRVSRPGLAERVQGRLEYPWIAQGRIRGLGESQEGTRKVEEGRPGCRGNQLPRLGRRRAQARKLVPAGRPCQAGSRWSVCSPYRCRNRVFV